MEKTTSKELAEKIFAFLKRCALERADFDPEWDDEEDRYASPDASMMKAAAESLLAGKKPDRVLSGWSMSGAYRGTEEDGKEHKEILDALREFY